MTFADVITSTRPFGTLDRRSDSSSDRRTPAKLWSRPLSEEPFKIFFIWKGERNAKEKTPLSAIAKTRLLERIAINVNQLNAPETDGSGPYRKTDNL